MSNTISIHKLKGGKVAFRIGIDHTTCNLTKGGYRCSVVATVTAEEWRDVVKSLERKASR